ncbi:MAG: HNH endonuclease [Elstera sp.]
MAPRRKLTSARRAAIFRDAGGVCHLCSRKIAPGEPWQIEHVLALALGGADEPENCRPAHADCHAAKTAADVRAIRKADRQARRHAGIGKSRNPIPGSRASKWKRRMDGRIEERE